MSALPGNLNLLYRFNLDVKLKKAGQSDNIAGVVVGKVGSGLKSRRTIFQEARQQHVD